MKTYLFRSTEDKIEQHLQRISDAGDVVEHVIFKGGRDYVLVCRNTAATDPVLDELRTIRELLEPLLQPPVARRIGDLPAHLEWVSGRPSCQGGGA